MRPTRLCNFTRAFLTHMLGNENEALVDLIRAFLKTEILDKEGNSYTCQEKGIPQGSPIPPPSAYELLRAPTGRL